MNLYITKEINITVTNAKTNVIVTEEYYVDRISQKEII